MSEHQAKATRSRKPVDPRDRRSRKYEAWKENIGKGMREAKLKRRSAGLQTPTEVRVELGLSSRAVAGIFPYIAIGGRNYIRRADVERWKAETGASAA
jgi:hypothetical protein